MNGGGVARMSVLERQQARVKWQLQTQVEQMGLGYNFGSSDPLNMFSTTPAPPQHFHGLIINDHNLGGLLETDPSAHSSNFASVGGGGDSSTFGFGSCELGKVAGFGSNFGVSRTASCPPAVAVALAEAASASASAATKRKETILAPEKLSSSAGRESLKKRKADKPPNQKVAPEEQSKDNNKRKGCVEEEESKVAEQKSNNNKTEPSETSKENSKVSEVQKPDYIHVRARRGQATDSHSLAERVRREKISERMKYLQDLVPGCNKITGKAGMLDEIINYVQSLQRQVEFLSMKLAAVNPRIDLDVGNIFPKEIFPVGTTEPHVIEESSEMNNPHNYHFSSLDQVVSCCGLETDKNLSDMVLRRTIPDTLIESPYFNQIHPYSTWDAELQSLYALEFQQGRSALLLSQPCAGFDGGSSVKIEM